MSISSAQEPSYETGYCKPPMRTRFQPGQSGNRSGRPKGVANLPDALSKALNERVAVSENGKRTKITKLEAIFKQLVNRAVGGDAKATRILMPLLEKNVALVKSSPAVIVISGADARL